MGLGIAGLPDSVAHLPTLGPVAAVALDEPAAETWLPALVEDALAAGPVGVAARSTEQLDNLLKHPPVQAAYRAGRLLLWSYTEDLPARIAQRGLGLLLQELERTGIGAGHELILCDTDSLLAGLSSAKLQRIGGELARVCQRRHAPVVLGFAPPQHTGDASPVQAMLESLAAGLPGLALPVASVQARGAAWSLRLDRWGEQAALKFALAYDHEHCRLTAGAQGPVPDAATAGHATDADAVIATRAAIAGQRGVPSHWHIVDDPQALQAAAASSVHATVLLDAGLPADFEQRARLVHQLRLASPSTLKIVVRENLGKLRTHSEQAMLHVGATAVVYKEVGFSRLLQRLEELRDTRHERQVVPDYDEALAGFLPVRARGYQNPAEFCRLVGGVLQRSQPVGLPHCLVRLQMLAQVPHLDALRACHTARDGDLVTADHDSIYVFLFACREPDVDAALSRLFTLPLTHIFQSESMDCTGVGIAAMLRELQESVRKALPDYTPLLEADDPIVPGRARLERVDSLPASGAPCATPASFPAPLSEPGLPMPADHVRTLPLERLGDARAAESPVLPPTAVRRHPIARRAVPHAGRRVAP